MSFVGFDYFSGIIVNEIKASPYMESGQVYDYAASSFDAYPAVIVDSGNLRGEFADNQRTVDEFSFTIMCFMSRKGREQATEQTMRSLVDDIVQRLSNNATINGTQNSFAKPITAQWGYAKAPEPDMRVCTLSLVIKTAQ